LRPALTAEDFRTIWLKPDDPAVVEIIDQRRLPHEYCIHELRSWQDACTAIADMYVRGAPLIGATAAWGLYLAALDTPTGAAVRSAADALLASRPTAVNLRWALERMRSALAGEPATRRVSRAYDEAARIADEDVAACAAIGRHGLAILQRLSERRGGEPVRVLTHCNAGWLACVDWGTALAPIYLAHEEGIPVHVWVDETRPRNQGAALTAWELRSHGIPHDVIVDNAGGHLMQRGLVDVCITGTDRTTRCGDVCNKIGTYLKALAAKDNGIPFYVALPESTIDWRCADGAAIPIEERDAAEVLAIAGRDAAGEIGEVNLAAAGTRAANPAFDVTPARLVSAIITEFGVARDNYTEQLAALVAKNR